MSSEKADVNLTVNGESHSVSVEPRELLSQTLRERLDYTSINIGCESTLCGACTIQVNGKAVKSCTRLTVQEDGSEIQTVQTLSDDGVLGDLQTAFADEHALQCGYCTPGILMVVDEYLDNNPDPSRDEIRTEALQGNLCRCTGYENIVDAIDIASDTLEE
ncbi:MAG: Aerobic-type carbon monoxide dehydrogenase, small subunit CoxS/CutS-like protein [Haloquadratum walsbyi J07HQW1]|jgi:carbon-monoxide dehydrogenase small subunit|uniref:Aerobic-type carbon monoxide dehydrogenase, small subunit CoxS/CutS-like protein n=1 Tax=Haloquadratum walsbyi J07HQW1 TaxID=1238424 RepID=U1N5J3_9EURY|nr:MAG: Aerobic-type carbon monoxide dehydrogenase, small subunit CoxS/CutS-like protein [Haloquadratum walsbyi J07HQW1]